MALTKIVTKKGFEKQINCLLNGSQYGIKYIAVGDGNGSVPNPTEDDTKLVNEVWRGEISELVDNAPEFTATVYIPAEAGDFIIREIGLFDENNALLFISQMDETPKKKVSSGLVKQIGLKVIFKLQNGLSAVIIDPSTVTASTNYVSTNFQKLSEKSQPDGYASLDSTGKVPVEQIPEAVSGMPVFCFNSGPVDEKGEAALLTLEGGLITMHAPAVCTTAGGKIYAVTEAVTLDISALADGRYNIFYDPETKSLIALANKVSIQKSRPGMADGDVWVDTSVKPYVCKKLNGSLLEPVQWVWNAVIDSVSGGV